MKTQLSLTQLANELERQTNVKRDFVAPTTDLQLRTPAQTGNGFGLDVQGQIGERFGVGAIAHRQIGGRVGIPARYYDRMREDAPELLASNVNHWFGNEPETRLVRTLDGRARAFLSDRYQIIDNYDVAEVALSQLHELGDVEPVSFGLTESRMYLKFVSTRTEAAVAVGDVVKTGVIITNSPVGLGAFRVSPLIFRLACLNGMVVPTKDTDLGLEKRHVGGTHAGDGVREILSNSTRKLTDQAFLGQVRDVVAHVLGGEFLRGQVEKMRRATDRRIEGNPATAVEVVGSRFRLTQDEQGGILRRLVEGGDLSQWGVINAVTRHSQDVDDYDRASELEKVGGKILELPSKDWRQVAEAA